MAKFFIDRPVFAIVLSLLISLCGALALNVLPIAQYPQITLPTINVSTAYVGANAEVVQESVAQVIEDKVNGVEGMLYMDSQSNGSGLYSLNVTFGLERNADMAAVLTQNRAATAVLGTKSGGFLNFENFVGGSAKDTLAGTNVNQVWNITADNGGTVVEKEYWGVKTMAYRINKNRKGHYAFLKSDAPAAAVQEMERLMRLHDDVMRVLTIKVDKHAEGPSVQMQKRDDRDRDGEPREQAQEFRQANRSGHEEIAALELGDLLGAARAVEDQHFELVRRNEPMQRLDVFGGVTELAIHRASDTRTRVLNAII